MNLFYNKWGLKTPRERIHGPSLMVTYLVQCARILEVTGFLYFLEKDKGGNSILKEVNEFLLDFILTENGCGHIPGDRYAVSLILPVLALIDSGNVDQVIEFIRRSTKWLCDRYEEGSGLASVEADEQTETNTLLGYAFDFIPLQHNPGSLTATVLSDLAAFTNQANLYEDVINDIKAVNIIPVYWQSPDTTGLYRIDSEEVIQHGNLQYLDHFTSFNSYQFAYHIKEEPITFRVVQVVGPISLMSVMLILRDRSFPKSWPLLFGLPNEFTEASTVS